MALIECTVPGCGARVKRHELRAHVIACLKIQSGLLARPVELHA